MTQTRQAASSSVQQFSFRARRKISVLQTSYPLKAHEGVGEGVSEGSDGSAQPPDEGYLSDCGRPVSHGEVISGRAAGEKERSYSLRKIILKTTVQHTSLCHSVLKTTLVEQVFFAKFQSSDKLRRREEVRG